jgi:pimeloyl-ACP methyl ester carboxylesterase
MFTKESFATASALLVCCVSRTAVAVTLDPHQDVSGPDVVNVEVRPAGGSWRAAAWDDLDGMTLPPGPYEIRADVIAERDAEALWVPVCAGRSRVTVDGRPMAAPPGPLVVPLSGGRHEAVVSVVVSGYERRIACGDRPRVGAAVRSLEGLGSLAFASPTAGRGGGRAVVYVPPGHDPLRPAELLVGLHPWNGSIWTYAAYAQLLREARRRDVVLLMPSGLGNSLYTSDAEDEVLRAIDALSDVLAIDPRAVSLWGASMGGAGATTIAFHHPDRFASATSFFGDSKYDLGTYVRAILPDEGAAHRVNALDVVDNARYLPVLLVHGEEDRTSPIRQSEELARAMSDRGYSVRFERVSGFGHSGALVARFLRQVVEIAATARVPASPSRVTYRSARPSDTGAYGVTLVRAQSRGDAYVDVERSGDGVHVRRSEGVRAILLARGALGTDGAAPPVIVDDTRSVSAAWEAPR